MNFIHIPKTGGMSIIQTLGLTDEYAAGGPHRRASEVGSPRFTFVRCPYDRLRSAWDYCQFRGRELGPNFREFVLSRAWGADVLFRPMTHFIDSTVEFVGRYEHLVADFQRLCDWLGVAHRPLREDHVLRVQKSEYDDEMLAVVRREFAEDFTRFGY